MNQLARKLQIKTGQTGRLLVLPRAVEHLFSSLPDELTASAGTELGYRPVRQISIDETWSALGFRKKELGK